MAKWVYLFREGNADMRNLLGGKGANLADVSIDFTEGDTIVVVAGAWKDTVGAVYKIDYNKQTVTINVELFGRDTPVEISFSEVRKLD